MLPELSEIKIRRKKIGLTQKELAKLVGISQSAIAKIENGKMIPNYKIAKAIFEKLEELESKSGRKAKDVMSKPVIYVAPEDDIRKASTLLLKHKISQLPVIKNGKVVGRINEKIVITEKGEKCKDIMGLPYPVVNENTPLEIVEKMLTKEEMVVVSGKNGEIKGVITRSDLIRI